MNKYLYFAFVMKDVYPQLTFSNELSTLEFLVKHFFNVKTPGVPMRKIISLR